MSKEKPAGSDTEQALRTLDQLGQTIEVMSEVVERLKRHLGRQSRQGEKRLAADASASGQAAAPERKSPAIAPATAGDWNPAEAELEIEAHRRGKSRGSRRVIH